jgi:hypothetical protein
VAVKYRTNRSKILVAVLCGFLVGGVASGIHFAMIPHDPALLTEAMLGDLIAGLTAIIVCLAIQLRQEEVHFASAMARTAIVAELNHHVRNAVFPLCLALQKTGDKEAVLVANEAVDRINIALREATADAISGQADYSEGSRNGNGA